MFSIEKIRRDWFTDIRANIHSGIVVALALIPGAIGFSIIVGSTRAWGHYASVIIAIVISFAGGRPAMISAATAATAVLFGALVRDHGLEYLPAATILTGIIQIFAGWLWVGYIMRFVSRSVLTGFVNALAILMFMAQLPELIGVTWETYAVIAAGLAIIYLFHASRDAIPSPLVCILVLTGVALAIGIDIRTVGDLGELPDALLMLLFPTAAQPRNALDHPPHLGGRGGGGTARKPSDRIDR